MVSVRSGLSIFLSAVLIASVYGQCPKTPNDCVNATKFNELSQGDPSFYCEEGAKRVAEAENCLRSCQVSQPNSFLVTKKSEINTFCFKNETDDFCPNVADTFVNQTRCYDDYRGLDTVIANIVAAFESGVPNFMEECNFLYWGRYCQKTQTCQFNRNLDEYLIKQNKKIGLGLAICGSESLKTILQLLEESEGCPVGNDMEDRIQKNCDIACRAADAETEKDYCALLELQAACLEKETAGCSRTERLYVKPRLNSYAVANRYLGCNITYNGITVKPSGRTFDYSELINQCSHSHTTEPLTLLALQQLFNFDTPYLADFCKSRDDQEKLIADCRNAFLAAATPQFKLLSRTEDDLNAVSTDFVPIIGTFPVDSYGMAYTYNLIPDDCANRKLQWSERICIPSSEKTTIKPIVTPKPKTTPAKATRDQNAVGDPSTPGNTNGNGNGNGGGLTRAPAEDFQVKTEGPSGNSAHVAVVSVVLLIASALLSLIQI